MVVSAHCVSRLIVTHAMSAVERRPDARSRPDRGRRSAAPRGRRTAARPSSPPAAQVDPASSAAARCAAPEAVGAWEQPEHGRPRAADERVLALPRRGPAASVRAICGHSETAARWRSLCSSSRAGGSGAPSSSATASARRRSLELGERAPAQAGRPRRTPPPSRARRRGGSTSSPNAGCGSGSAASCSPAPVASQRPG